MVTETEPKRRQKPEPAEKKPKGEQLTPPPTRSRRRPAVIAAGVALVIVGALGSWWYASSARVTTTVFVTSGGITRGETIESQDLTTLERTRATQSKQRRRSKLPLVALVGYTNAGKSSLMNRLTEADVLERDQLFSTLGSTVRKLNLPSGTEILLSDTVGFVQRLPHELVEAFRSTLDQIADADLILHVVDASDSDVETRIAAVREVLSQIDGAVDIPEVVVFNKQDLADDIALGRLQRLHPEAETVYARTGHRTAALLERITDELTADAIEATLRVPWDRGDVIAHLRGASAIVKEEPFDSAMVITTRIDRDALRRFEEFVESA